jgi:hypothetical protein
MTDEQLNKLIEVLDIWFGKIADEIHETKQMIKACAITQIELPNGYDATTILEQINLNFEGA